ncbi:MAG: hypothetical protein M1839_005603 [Geoglossum umbratile]|nr:MAG: hypothetical protein M1839_005603 [Geoglossum umbratile]
MTDHGGDQKESSDETVYSVISGISGASTVSAGPLRLSTDEQIKPLRDPVDSRFAPTKQTFAIAPDDPIVSIWNSSLGDQVITLIKPNTDWRTLDVIRRGYRLQAEENHVVIRIIILKSVSVSEWLQLIGEIKKCCISEQYPNVLVQAREGEVFRGIFIPRPYDQRPFIGGSVGVVGRDHSGTLGGYFDLRQEGQEVVRVSVTCHHVVEGSADLSCISPDSNHTIDISSDFKRHKAQVQDIKNRANEGLACNAELHSLPNREASLIAEEASVSASGSFNTHVRQVFASSGFCHSDRLENNKFPEGVFSQFSCPNPRHITKTIAIDIGDRAVKWGRTTKSTAGTFSSIKSHVNFLDSNGLSTEWCFVRRDGHEFGNRGDSGSFVLSKDGDLGGMIVGGSDDGPGGFILTYVTPIAEVLNDIERQLGCSVYLPRI